MKPDESSSNFGNQIRLQRFYFADLDTHRRCADGVEPGVGERSNDSVLSARIECSPHRSSPAGRGHEASPRSGCCGRGPWFTIFSSFRASYQELCSQSTNSQNSLCMLNLPSRDAESVAKTVSPAVDLVALECSYSHKHRTLSRNL